MRLGLTKALGAAAALITAALVGGTLIGSALAIDDPATGETGLGADAGAYCDTFMDTLATELGTTRDGLVAAGKTAANAAIDAAEAAGDITAERAATMRERVAEYDGEGCRWFDPRPGGHGPRGPGGFGRGFIGRGFIGANTLDAAAVALGIEESGLKTELREDGSLEAVAEAHGVAYADVSAAVLAAVQADVDAAIEAGNLAQERADSIIGRVTTWLDNGGELRGPRHGDGPPGVDSEEDGA